MSEISDTEFLAKSDEHGQYFEEVERIVAGVVEDKHVGQYRTEGKVQDAIREAALQSRYFKTPALWSVALEHSDYPCTGFLHNSGAMGKRKASDPFPFSWLAYYALAADCLDQYAKLIAVKDVKPIGQFIVLEGPDAGGKTTQLKLLRENLEKTFPGIEIVDCHAPGGTEFGNRVRSVLLDKTGGDRSPLAETLLFLASLDSLLREVIRPALGRGAIVISSRYILSTFIYQGVASGLAVSTVADLASYVLEDLWPDLTLVLDICGYTAKERLGNQRDRIESRGDDYFQKIRMSYLHAADDPTRSKRFSDYRSRKTVYIDATHPIGDVSMEILRYVAPMLVAAGFSSNGSITSEHTDNAPAL